eukprot:COSAG01_NODE_2228_length_8130_cov_11.575395_11_plen_367_part_00
MGRHNNPHRAACLQGAVIGATLVLVLQLMFFHHRLPFSGPPAAAGHVNDEDSIVPTGERMRLGNELAMWKRRAVDESLYRPSQREKNPLLQIAEANARGPVLWKWAEYFQAYHANFHALRARGNVTMLLVGINTGGDLFLFREYFGPSVKIWALDVNPECAAFESEDFVQKVFIGSQGDAELLEEIGAEIGHLDIVLDDASHDSTLTTTTMNFLWKYVKTDGVYFVEDLLRQETFKTSVFGMASAATTYCNGQLPNTKSVDTEIVPCGEANHFVIIGATVAIFKTAAPPPSSKVYGQMRLPYKTSPHASGAEAMRNKFSAVYTGKQSRLDHLQQTVSQPPLIQPLPSDADSAKWAMGNGWSDWIIS